MTRRFGPSRWRRRAGEAARLAGGRLAVAVPIVLAVSVGVFLLAAFSPFDPLTAYLGDRAQYVGQEAREQMAAALGLDRPWWAAWLSWARGLTSGDLGWSRLYAQPVTQVFAERIGWTMLLSGCGIALALVVSIGLGLRAGLRPGSALDRFAVALAVLLQALPAYVLALVAVLVFALGLHVLPTGGIGPPGRPLTAAVVARHLVLPTCVLAASLVPWMLLSVRASVREALSSEPVRGALARGLSPRAIVRGHILPVSLAPVVTLLGARLPELVVGAVLVEEVFSWPGLAAATVSSALSLDLALLAALTIATTLLVLLGSLLADALYLVLDPRVTP